MFPKWSELCKIWKNWKTALWSSKEGDALKAWSGILAALSLFSVLLAGYGWFRIVVAILLVLTVIKLSLNSVDKSE